MANISSQEYKSRAPELHQHLYDIDLLARQEYGVSVEQNPCLPLMLTDANFYEYSLNYVHQPPIDRDPRLQEILGADAQQGPAIEDFALITQTKVDLGYRSQIQTVYRGEQSNEYSASNMRISVKGLADRAMQLSGMRRLVVPYDHVDRLMTDVLSLSIDNLYIPADRHAEKHERYDMKKRIQSSTKNIFDHHQADTFTDDQLHIVRYRSGNGHQAVDVSLTKRPGFGYSKYQNQAAKQCQKISLSLQQHDKQVVFDVRPNDMTDDMTFTTYRPKSRGRLEPIIDAASLNVYSEMVFISNFLERLEANVDHSSLDTPDSIAEVEPLPRLKCRDINDFIDRFAY